MERAKEVAAEINSDSPNDFCAEVWQVESLLSATTAQSKAWTRADQVWGQSRGAELTTRVHAAASEHCAGREPFVVSSALKLLYHTTRGRRIFSVLLCNGWKATPISKGGGTKRRATGHAIA